MRMMDEFEDIEIYDGSEVVDQGEAEFRTLFIGLGGTGGEVLCKLNGMLDDDQKEKAHMIYLDMDTKDTTKLSAMGVPTVNISSADTVRDVIRYLGREDGVLDWIPHGENDNEFLSSKTDDGASQFRLKSRLCLAKYLSESGNELEQLLDQISTPGVVLANETLRVMIVSSVAGGTGAGTFIQMALYLREYFRNHGHRDISIMGLFACPDLFARAQAAEPGDKSNVEKMYSNAYAAIRELNAMNLAVNYSGKARMAAGYGKSINIAIKTESEGLLFDSNDPAFSANANNKPYNQMYFVDVANVQGGVLRTMKQYYDVMADIVYTRLYSPLERAIRSDECNELDIHSHYPTAIYGSAGYGRIIYPYQGIINYLSVRKTFEELDYTWSMLENEWEKYKRNEKMIAKASGTIWNPTSEQRAKRYISDMNDFLEKSNSRLRPLAGMIKNPGSAYDRAEEFLRRLNKTMESGNGMEADTIAKDKSFGLAKDEDVFKTRETMVGLYNQVEKKKSSLNSSGEIIKQLQTFSKAASLNMNAYVTALTKNVVGRAQFIASQVAPRNKIDGIAAEQEKSDLNLFSGLLCVDGVAVHPLAARYLLYRLREKMQEKIKANKEKSSRQKMLELCTDLNLALDSNLSDGVDVTVDVRIKQLQKTFFLYREGEARAALDTYIKKYEETLGEMMKEATRNLSCEVYIKVLEVVDILIAQYEGLFENLGQYKHELEQRVIQERGRHESASDDRCVYIDASREAKEYCYSGDLRTKEVLDNGGSEIASAAGQGIYNSLIARTWKILEDKENRLLTEYDRKEEKIDTYSDLGGVFTDIVKIYREYLKEHAPHLKISVTKALIRESCRRAGLSEDQLTSRKNRTRVRTFFELVISDMINKAQPMLNFDRNNSDTYFEEEADDERTASTKLYMHIGMNSTAGRDLSLIYECDTPDAGIGEFAKVFKPSRGVTTSEEYTDFELVCFKAVHCLQPTQIRKFRENYPRGYYHSYKKLLAKIVATNRLSSTPHLDKRWHLREAMPYISRNMESAWHKKTTKAFIHEVLNRKLRFTTDGDGTTCFTYIRDGKGQGAYVRWPEEKLVTVNDISRLLEYLQEQDERVERISVQMDEQIDAIMERLSKYTDSMPVYKSALTTNETLRDLRGKLMVRKNNVSTLTAGHGKNASVSKARVKTDEEMAVLKKAQEYLGVEDVEDFDAKDSLGGLLELAWLIHRSEEKQRRDHDFGEAIITCGLELVEKLCQTFCGEDVSRDSSDYSDYKDLYNSILEKFMESYVTSMLSRLKLMDESVLKDMKYVVFHRYLKVPEIVYDTAEYEWVTSLWTKK